jgi:hypothetical protein
VKDEMPVLESTIDLREIPVRAILAYSARSARRVQHLYCVDNHQPEAEACMSAIETSLRLCEEFANGAEIDPQLVSQTESATIRTLQLAMEADPVDKGAAYAANAAYAVINAVQAALEVNESPEGMPAAAEKIIESATIARDASVAADPSIHHAVELDWEKLRRMHLGKFPAWGECVDATESGILGPLSGGAARDSDNRDAAECRDAKQGDATDSPVERAGDSGEALDQQSEPKSDEETPDRQAASQGQTLPDLSDNREQVRVDQLREDQEKLDQERDALRSQEDVLRSELNAFRNEQDAFLSQREALADEQAKWLADREALAGEQEKLQAERQLVGEERAALESEVSQQSAELAEERSQFETDRENLAGEQENWLAEREALAVEQEKLQTERQLMGEERAALEREISQQSAELAEERSQFEADREALAGEQELLQALREEVQQRTSEGQLDQNNFVAEQQQLSRQRSKLQVQKQKLQTKLSDLRAKRSILRKDRTRMEADAKQLALQKQEMSEKGDALEQLQQELDQQRAELNGGQGDLQTGREKWQVDACALEVEQQRFQQQVAAFEEQRQRFEQESTAIEQAHENLQKEQAAVDQQTATLESDRALWESQTASLQSDRAEIEAQREELQNERDSLQDLKGTLLKEKARLAGLEAEIQETRSQLSQQTSRHQDADDASNHRQDPQTSTTSGNELQTLLGRMVEERQELLNERTQLTEDLARLQRLRSEPSEHDDESPVDDNAPEHNRAMLQPLRVILDPGIATASQIGELLRMLTDLYRQLGGPGVCFAVSRTTSWNIEEPGAQPLDESRGEQNYVEIIASPRARTGDSDVEVDGRAWERFESCLRMVLKTDAGLADFLELGVALSSDHRTCQLAAEAAKRGSTVDECQDSSLDTSQAAELPVDCIHLQLQRIDELRGRLEREDRMFLELAPAIEFDQKGAVSDAEAAVTPPAQRSRRNRARKVLLAIAALAAIVIGACCW